GAARGRASRGRGMQQALLAGRRRRTPRDMSLEIGARVLLARRGDAAAGALATGVSKRTLSRWKRRAREQEAAPRWGRPGHSEAARGRAEVLVTREREKQGKGAGEGPLSFALGGAVPVRLLRRVLSDLKRNERREER